ncbi:MAG TPA: Hsp20/alpha crystallin family protein [Thermoanaerobaculia bacterium]
MPENENQGSTATMEPPMPHEEQAENQPPLQGQGSHNTQNQGSLNQGTSLGQTPGHSATQSQGLGQSQAQSPSYSSSSQSSSSMPSTGGTSGTSGMSGYEGRRSSGLSRRDPFSALGFGNPFAMMRQLADEMDRVFDNLGLGSGWGAGAVSRSLDRPTAGGGSAFWSPQIDVSRRGNELVVCADLPGMKKEDIRVEVREDHLILEGERRQEQEEDREGYFRSERSWGRFYRAIPLPDGVNPEQAQASFNDGVLEIKLPLPQQQERSRRIEIR